MHVVIYNAPIDIGTTRLFNLTQDLKTEPDLLIEIIQRKASMHTQVPVTTELTRGPFGQAEMWSGSRR